VKLDWRVRALDAVMTRAGTIASAGTLEEVQALRTRRELQTGPALRPVVERLSQRLFGRPHREVRTEDRAMPGPAGPIGYRLYLPPRVGPDAPLVINFHGGGWVLGDLDGNDWVCSVLAGDLGVVVASVEYRLAPECPAPAGPDDCIAATRWLATHAAEIGATGPIAVMGDSAGGNLAALVAIAARDAGGPSIAAQVLMYPAVDLTLSFPSIRALGDAPILRLAEIEAFRAHYLGADGDPADPRLSPWAVADLSGLPPTLVQTAEHDPLRDEGRAYSDRLRAAGVESRWTEYAGMPHGYVSLPGICRAAPQAVAEIAQFLAVHLR
jgi:acetyl esterase/lipase